MSQSRHCGHRLGGWQPPHHVRLHDFYDIALMGSRLWADHRWTIFDCKFSLATE